MWRSSFGRDLHTKPVSAMMRNEMSTTSIGHDQAMHFPDWGRHEAPSLSRDGLIQLHIVLDQSSIELFGNDGLVAITDLIFPDRSDNGAGAYVDGDPPKIISLNMWTLQGKRLVTIEESKGVIKAGKLR
ncbi:MAG: hypothetical protein DMG97_27880 [Acidobacteria bacterium]|nr:MAG: hypothetical protein DMG97_27880 [Acidobacteriota bacterium]